jgi:hypothetical protein
MNSAPLGVKAKLRGASMAIHPNTNSLTVEVIEEYLDVAKMCIDARKPDGGIYGYPATLLLFCVINALGANLLKSNEPFQVLMHEPFNCKLSNGQVKKLETWYRNLLAHNGMIAPGVCLSPQDTGEPVHFDQGEPVLIRVKALYNLVRAAWEHVDKSSLDSKWLSPKKLAIRNPVDFSNASAAVPIAASGSPYVPPPLPKVKK